MRGLSDRFRLFASAATLFGLLAGHTILEVARDSLFLSRLAARDLVVAYLLIAVTATAAAQLDARLLRRLDDRQVLTGTLLVAATGAFVFHALFLGGGSWVPYAFYVWTGTLASVAVAQFWRLLTSLFTVATAKRFFAPIGAGGAFGAMVGAGAAELARHWLEPEGLLRLGGIIFAATALVPGLVLPPPVRAPRARRRQPVEQRRQAAASTRSYLGRLLALLVVTAVVATLVDFAFKRTVEDTIAPAELVPFFARFYFGLNLASMVVQVGLAPFLLRTLGVTRALVVLPAALALGALGGALVGGLAAAIAVRGVDGGLRQSLHRSAIELLYFPLTTAARRRYKTSLDALGQRAGQVVGSLAIILASAAALTIEQFSLVIVALAVVFGLVALSLRRGYVDLFRANLRAGAIESTAEVPALDLHSLESLIEALNSERDDEVLATLELLVTYDRARLVPALLLYHPSRTVVLRTCEILRQSGRTDYVAEARHLLSHADPDVRASASSALGQLLEPHELRAQLHDERTPAARAGALVALVARSLDRDGSARREIDECAHSGTAATRLALARAVRLAGDRSLAPVLHVLATAADAPLRREVARGLGEMRDATAVGTLLYWLGPRGARAEAREALVAIGTPALDALEAAFSDLELPRELRAHLPRTIARFDSPRALDMLVARLDDEPDGWVRHKMLRALRMLGTRADGQRVDRARLDSAMRTTLVRATDMLRRRIAVRAAHASEARLRTPAAQLLEPLLREKEEQALDRTVRLVGLRHPDAALGGLAHAIWSLDARLRAEARELLANVADPALAPALAAMLDEDAADDARLSRACSALGVPTPELPTYARLVGELVGDESEAVRCIAAHHAGELHLAEIVDELERARARATQLSAATLDRALERLTASEEVAGA